MHKYFYLIFVGLLFLECKQIPPTVPTSLSTPTVKVSTKEELQTAISEAQPGDEIVMKNGVWEDVRIRFIGEGTKENPIVLRAETPGKVIIEGASDLKFGGKYLVAKDLYFQNGHTPTNAIVEFRIDNKQLANHCRLTNSVIENYNQNQRDKRDHWVEFWGRHNQMDHCYIAGKSNKGPTVRVQIKGNASIRNYHQIVDNHFGPRPRKGGPSAETIQIGDSGTSMSPCNTMVARNLFERCNGEVEVISSKTNFNEFRNNVFYKCEGSLVTRHGNYCVIDGNYFIGDESKNVGGVRIINTGHWVTNNYFYSLRGTGFLSPLAVMNGIPKSPLNRYNQVTDVVVAHNTWVNCESPWHFGIGSNIDQKDVLPKSEIRSARPKRMVVANNLIVNEKADNQPIVEHAETDGIKFKNNLLDNAGSTSGLDEKFSKGVKGTEIEMKKVGEGVFIPTTPMTHKVYEGFDFETIDKDLFGNSRNENNSIGAVCGSGSAADLLDVKKYGTSWYKPNHEIPVGKTIAVTSADDLVSKIHSANEGDIIELKSGKYTISNVIKIDKRITIKGMGTVQITYSGAEGMPLFEMNPRGDLILENVELMGTGSQIAFATLEKNMSSLYNLKVSNSKISNFDFVLKAYKESFSNTITFNGTSFKNCKNGIELSQETNDRGDYNVEFLTFEDCEFENIPMNVIDYYRGGYDESTIGGNLKVSGCTFTNCGAKEENKILLNHRGIINVDISKNTFKNNPVKVVSVLWGAKNNTHSDNEIINSGEIKVEENIKLKLMY